MMSLRRHFVILSSSMMGTPTSSRSSLWLSGQNYGVFDYLNRGNNYQIRTLSIYSRFKDELNKQIKNDKVFQEHLRDLENKRKEIEGTRGFKGIKDLVKVTTAITVSSLREAIRMTKSAWNKARESQLAQTTRSAVEAVAEKSKDIAEKVSEVPTVKKVVKGVETIKDELIDSEELARYGGFRTKEAREIERKRRQLKEKSKGLASPFGTERKRVEANSEAGTSVVLHKDAAWKEGWNKFKESNPILRGLFGMKKSLEESDNPLTNTGRAVSGRLTNIIASIFGENELTKVIRSMNLIDTTFSSESFLTEARNYILPEVIEAWLKGDLVTLRLWMAESMYNMISELISERQRQGIKVDYKILDLRGVDIAAGKMIEDRPILFVTANVQQITLFRDHRGTIVSGKEDDIQRVIYLFAITRSMEDMSSPTNGWKIMEMTSRGGSSII